MAQTASYQLRNTDIRVNAICPGLIETGMTTMTFDYAASRGTSNKIGQLNPLGRYGVAEGTHLLDMPGAAVVHSMIVPRNRKHSAVPRFRFVVLPTYVHTCPHHPNTDESSYINGQCIAVDGGLSSSHPVAPGKWA